MSSRRASRPIMHARPMKKRKAADSPQHAASRRPAEPSRQRKGASGSMGCTSELVPGFAAFAFACLVLRGKHEGRAACKDQHEQQ